MGCTDRYGENHLDDFFVPDEPVEDVKAAFERSKRGVTTAPPKIDFTPLFQAVVEMLDIMTKTINEMTERIKDEQSKKNQTGES